MANSFFGGGWRAIWSWLWRTSVMMFSTPPPPGTGSPPHVHPPPHLRHLLRSESPPRAGPWRGGSPLAGALPVGAGEGRADRR